MLPVSRFTQFIKQNKLFDASDKLLLAVSGGKDSVLMAHIFNESGLTFGIAHCNFKLRGSDSDADEAFVKTLAESFGAPFYSKAFDTTAISTNEQISIQMAARKLRFEWFEQLRLEFGYNFIALAHHQDDVIETVLLNLTRGTGIAGLHGILPKNGFKIRPLLFLSRQEIDELITNNKIAYREDASNSSVKYARNKIRHQVIPHLKELNPQLAETFTQNSKRFLQVENFLNTYVNKLRKLLFVKQQSGDFHIEISRLQALKSAELLLFELFKPFHFTEQVLSNLSTSWDGNAGKVYQSRTHQLLLDRGILILSPKLENTAYQYVSSRIEPHSIEIKWLGNTFIQSAKALTETAIEKTSSKAFFDSEKLIYPLTIRAWHQGDVFKPFGMHGKKKLSDYFISEKIPSTQKSKIPIVVNGNGDILWVAGYRADDRYKVTATTKKVVTLEIIN